MYPSNHTKPHYLILDGLRGVAALLVICYHIFEAFATSPLDQHFNHGYLAVDFFFLLSGFVVGYAYDDRLRSGALSTGEFLLRRLIRLHPMVVMASVVGLVSFLGAGCERWDGTTTPIAMVIVAFVMSLFMIPAGVGSGADVRGNGELFSLNGPAWSLFFEYIGNIIYVTLLRRLSTRHLRVVVALLGLMLATYAVGDGSGYGNIGVGWTFANHGFAGGLLRLLFSFSLGLLISRDFKPWNNARRSFLWCSVALVVLLAMPRLGGQHYWVNALYEVACITVLFPLVLRLGASGRVEGTSERVSRLLGDISYPLYIVHYPLMYLFYRHVWNNSLSFGEAWPVAVGVVVASIALAWCALRLYDLPLRKRLLEKLRHKSK